MSKSRVASEQSLDLQGMSVAELEALARDLRREILEVTAANGGHLATNLGAVELTLALHSALATPRDRIFLDVGNQCYAHKILTGRRERFAAIRQAGGLSGFVNRFESPHDPMTSGHAATALSSAIGLARARDVLGGDYRIAAVVGDGALSAGLTYEALNNLSLVRSQLLLIVNDNGFAISPNVGGIAGALDRARSRLLDGGLFEQLGLEYVGPVDGHDVGLLAELCKRLARSPRPVVLHAVTQKGRGYPPAERDPAAFHSSKPFDLSSGAPRPEGAGTSYSDFFGAELTRLAAEDPRVVALTAAMPAGTGLAAFARACPERFFDVGIAEQHAVTMAAGLALGGCRPVVAIYSTFMQRAFDQVVHDVCLQGLPVTFVMDRAGLVGADGPTHHGALDLSFLRSVPGLALAAPRNLSEFARLLRTAVAHPGPVAIRIPRAAEEPPARIRREPLPVGRAEVLREGSDVGLLAVGSMVPRAVELAERLAARQISAQVVNARWIKPLDAETLLRTAGSVRRVVTLEENAAHGGFGSAVAELLAQHAVATPLMITGLPDTFLDHGDREALLAANGLSVEALVQRIVDALAPAAASRHAPYAIDPAECRAAIEAIAATELPAEIRGWVAEYEQVGHRNPFLWKWCCEGVRLTTLAGVDTAQRPALAVTKVLGIMLDVLLDDVADRSGRDAFLDRLLAIPWGGPPPLDGLAPEEQHYATVVSRIWNEFESRFRGFPRFGEFEDCLRYDYRQLLNAMRYSHMVNRMPHVANLVEHDMYLPHNMHMMISGTFDLMCSSGFDVRELGAAREMLWRAQCMGRIGNLLTTWERELGERDFTSGVFPFALEQGWLTHADLAQESPETLRARLAERDVEGFFLERWLTHRQALDALQPRLRSVDVGALRRGLERLIRLHLGSRGLK